MSKITIGHVNTSKIEVEKKLKGANFLKEHVEFLGLEHLDDTTRKDVQDLVISLSMKMKAKHRHLEKIHLSIKKIHKREKSEKYEVTAKAKAKDFFVSKETSYDIFFCIHTLFNKMQNVLASTAE